MEFDRISELFINIIAKFYENNTKARTFGTDTELFHSEIHTLQYIMDHPGLHISGIARELGITRGAVSQTVKRLERKKMILKDSSPDDNKKKAITLTAKGKTACFYHKRAHEKHRAVMSALLADCNAEQLQFLSNFLCKFEKTL
jgi:DNA-binding MarR family transcriptional regulator